MAQDTALVIPTVKRRRKNYCGHGHGVSLEDLPKLWDLLILGIETFSAFCPFILPFA